ncbi:MAG TPA: hypothetical protein VME42_00320 [Steroidobacteraceae bacterium]|nr:hypothetical protein [Steroidobacteraceae bacterium]
MPDHSPPPAALERVRNVWNGWLILLLNVAVLVVAWWLIKSPDSAGGAAMLLGRAMAALGVVMLFGYFTLQPNEARVLILFGAYQGTVRRSGFHWANPLYARTRGKAPGNAGSPSDGTAGSRR